MAELVGTGEEKLFALTFDDGPDREGTAAVLESLAELKAPAAFFLLGEQVRRAPDVAVAVAAAGHEIGCHGYAHAPYPEREDRDVVADLRKAARTIEAVTGKAIRRFRPPYGRFSEISLRECARRGWQPVLWSCRGLDWENRSPESIAANVLRDLRPGAIVLLHDGTRGIRGRSRLATAAALPLIVARARELGYRPAGLGEILGSDNVYVQDRVAVKCCR